MTEGRNQQTTTTTTKIKLYIKLKAVMKASTIYDKFGNRTLNDNKMSKELFFLFA